MRSTSHLTLLCVLWVFHLLTVIRAEKSAVSTGFLGDIDLVFTWVATPNATELAAFKLTCPHESGGIQRLRDTGTFRVALKLALKNLPWVRHIYVVTNGHFPDWLKPASAHKKIKFVTHKDMWKPEWHSDLPTYSSMAIESHVHRIQGLAEHFIYVMDDVLFLRPIARSDVVDAHGMPHFFTNDFSDTADWKAAQRDFVRGALPERPRASWFAHMAWIFRKSFIEKAQRKWPHMIETASHSKCRVPFDTSPILTYNIAHVIEGATPSTIHDFKWLHINVVHGNEETKLDHIRDFFNTVRASKPYIICINDDFDEDAKKAERQLAFVKEYLAEVDHEAGPDDLYAGSANSNAMVAESSQTGRGVIFAGIENCPIAMVAMAAAIVMILASLTVFRWKKSLKYQACETSEPDDDCKKERHWGV